MTDRPTRAPPASRSVAGDGRPGPDERAGRVALGAVAVRVRRYRAAAGRRPVRGVPGLRASSPVARTCPSTSARLLLTGVLFAGTGSLVALSPLGRRSGAHLNPAVTLAFWTQRKVHPHDLAGYVIAQIAGAVTAVACLRVVWGTRRAPCTWARRSPATASARSTPPGSRRLMTASLILMIFFFTSHARTARWTPLGNWLLVATLVWQGAPYTGTSLNPARSLGPALVAPELANLWVYLAGPCAGALLAAAVFAAFRDTHTLTAKLFHDPRYPSTLASVLPTAPTTTSPSAPRTTR